MRRAFTYSSGLVAIGLYLLVVTVLFFSLSSTTKVKEEIKQKKEQVIAIDMSTIESLDENVVVDDKPAAPPAVSKPDMQHDNKSQEAKQEEPTKSILPKQQEQKAEVETKDLPVVATKTPEIDKVVKPVDTKNSKIVEPVDKKQNLKDLFSGIKSSESTKEQSKTETSTKDIFKNLKTNSPAQQTQPTKSNTANGRTEGGTGEGAKKQEGVPQWYKDKVEKRLNSWPVDEKYAGEKALIHFTIKTSGAYEFSIVSCKSEPFKKELVQYLKQLQTIGFDPHTGNRSYSFNITFEARE